MDTQQVYGVKRKNSVYIQGITTTDTDEQMSSVHLLGQKGESDKTREWCQSFSRV